LIKEIHILNDKQNRKYVNSYIDLEINEILFNSKKHSPNEGNGALD
tara:strand:+ start:16045 stop:16182 length:138 start_codon:yes stop_codon:yes gene_type:complete